MPGLCAVKPRGSDGKYRRSLSLASQGDDQREVERKHVVAGLGGLRALAALGLGACRSLVLPAEADQDGELGDEQDEPTDEEIEFAAAADSLDAALRKLQEPDVAEQAREILGERRPDFLLFQEPDRVLDSAYSLTDKTL